MGSTRTSWGGGAALTSRAERSRTDSRGVARTRTAAAITKRTSKSATDAVTRAIAIFTNDEPARSPRSLTCKPATRTAATAEAEAIIHFTVSRTFTRAAAKRSDVAASPEADGSAWTTITPCDQDETRQM